MRLFRKASLASACAVLVLLVLFSRSLMNNSHALNYKQVPPKIPRCGFGNLTALAQRWRTLEEKYKELREDKFTIALSTFHRPKELEHTLNSLLSIYIPSLHEVVVVWNNIDQVPPNNFTSSHGVHVRYRASSRNNLNEKLLPDTAFQTKAILLSDDDVYYHPSDLEYVFQMWREFGQDRLVGAPARCASVDIHGDWEYHSCSLTKGKIGAYSIVLTGLAFSHVGFLEYYFSDAPDATQMREYADAEFNCEDIALNVLASMLSGKGPLLVRGNKQWVNLSPTKGISRKPKHMATRSRCLNRFAAVVGCMPLVDEIGRMERGYKHDVWYKSLWDSAGML